MSFSQLNLSSPMLRALSDLGYTTPSPIQAQSLPILLDSETDFLGLAATGTGKTAAFGIPLLEKIDPELKRVQAMVLCPTRELALQVCGQINLLGKYKNIRAAAIYGGASYRDQINQLKQGASVVVGTPGRLVDYLEQGLLKLDALKVMVLDEADEMISMGFKEALEFILDKTPRESSDIWLFSATMSREVRKVADRYLRDPEQVQVNQTKMLSATVEQKYVFTREGDKPEILCKLIEGDDNFYGLVFCQTKSLVTELTQYLTERGYKVDSLHGDKDQKSRERTMKAFRERKVNLLICTDVASRGLDVKDITHVINYSLPRELDSYVHRIGRTARSGKTGIAISLVTPSHKFLLKRIEQVTKTRIDEATLPTRRELGMKKVAAFLPTFLAQTQHTKALELLDPAWREALATMSAEEVAARFLAVRHPEIFAERPKKTPKPIEKDAPRPYSRPVSIRDRAGRKPFKRSFA